MPYAKSKGDVEWRMKGRKRPFAYSTVADRDIFNDLAEEHDGDVRAMMESARYTKEVRDICRKLLDMGVDNVFKQQF